MNRRRARLTSKLHFNFGTSSCLYVYSFSAFAYKLQYCTLSRVFVVLGFDSVCTRAPCVAFFFRFISFVCFLPPCAQLNTFFSIILCFFFSFRVCVCVICCFFQWFSYDSRYSHLIFVWLSTVTFASVVLLFSFCCAQYCVLRHVCVHLFVYVCYLN